MQAMAASAVFAWIRLDRKRNGNVFNTMSERLSAPSLGACRVDFFGRLEVARKRFKADYLTLPENQKKNKTYVRQSAPRMWNWQCHVHQNCFALALTQHAILHVFHNTVVGICKALWLYAHVVFLHSPSQKSQEKKRKGGNKSEQQYVLHCFRNYYCLFVFWRNKKQTKWK